MRYLTINVFESVGITERKKRETLKFKVVIFAWYECEFYFLFLTFYIPYKNLPLTMKYFYNQNRERALF